MFIIRKVYSNQDQNSQIRTWRHLWNNTEMNYLQGTPGPLYEKRWTKVCLFGGYPPNSLNSKNGYFNASLPINKCETLLDII